jgi:hypothetical protein
MIIVSHYLIQLIQREPTRLTKHWSYMAHFHERNDLSALVWDPENGSESIIPHTITTKTTTTANSQRTHHSLLLSAYIGIMASSLDHLLEARFPSSLLCSILISTCFYYEFCSGVVTMRFVPTSKGEDKLLIFPPPPWILLLFDSDPERASSQKVILHLT